MNTIPDIIDAVKMLAPEERADLFDKLRDLGFGPANDSAQVGAAAYDSPQFTRSLTECFHRAKRRALGAE